MPSVESVEIQPIGRGITQALGLGVRRGDGEEG